MIVGANPSQADADFPIITVESPLDVHAELDPATRRVVAARKAWTDRQSDATIRYYQTLYLADVTTTYAADGTEWREITRDEHDRARTYSVQAKSSYEVRPP